MKLRQCDCGGDPDVVHSFACFFVMCFSCGATGQSFASTTKVHGQWPKEAAERAWNDRIMDEGEP